MKIKLLIVGLITLVGCQYNGTNQSSSTSSASSTATSTTTAAATTSSGSAGTTGASTAGSFSSAASSSSGSASSSASSGTSTSSASSSGTTGSSGSTGLGLCESCTLNSDCASGYCDRVSRRCNAATPCDQLPAQCTGASLGCDAVSGLCVCPSPSSSTGSSSSSSTTGTSGSGSTSGTASSTGATSTGATSTGATSTGTTSTGTTSTGTTSSSASSSSSGASGTTGAAYQLAVESGDQQTGVVDQLLQTVTVRLTDGAGAPAAGEPVQVSPSSGAGYQGTNLTTNAQGEATFAPQLGRAPGSYTFGVSARGATATVTASASAAAAGTLYTVVNAGHASGTPAAGPGTLSGLGQPSGLVAAADGTLYIASDSRVMSLSPQGQLQVVAGTGQSGTAGDSGPATQAQLSPKGLALDEVNHLLYVACGDRVRVIDLASGNIDLFAGSGSAPGPGYGDNGPATVASLGNATDVSVGPDGTVYIGDYSRDTIRRVDPSSGIITSWMTKTSNCTAEVEWRGCYGGSCGGIVWDAQGSAFVAGGICGTGPGGSTHGVVRRLAGGGLAHVAGRYQGGTADNTEGTRLLLQSAPYLAFDPAGNLLLADSAGNRVWRVEGGSGRVTSLIGDGTAGLGTDYAPAAGAQVSGPGQLALDAQGTLYFPEPGNHAVRAIAGVALTSPAPAQLSLVSGDAQSNLVDQLTGGLVVKLTDSTGAVLQSYSVSWEALEPSGYVYTPSSLTNFTGKASTSARVGLVPGDYHFQASFADIHGNPVTGSPVGFTVAAGAPAAGTIFTVVNIDRATSPLAVTGPGVLAHLSAPTGAVAAADGNVYFSASNYVLKLTPDGQLQILAGTGASGTAGDSGPATQAQLSPRGLALDEVNHLLYVACGDRVRVIDLGSGTIYLFAGSGSAPAPTYGDNGPATSATLSNVSEVSVGPDGSVYFGDYSYDRIRKVDTSGTITTLIMRASTVNCTAALEWTGCYGGACGGMVWDSQGNAYISARFCGTALNGTTDAVVKLSPGGSLSLVAGHAGGGTADSVPATSAGFSSAPYLARDSGTGALFLADKSGNRVRRIDPATGLISTIAGDGTAAYLGDYVPGAQSELNQPQQLALDAQGHLVITDTGNNCVREVW